MSRALRFTASTIAVLSLALLGWGAFHPISDRPSHTTDVTLWTPGAIRIDGTAPNAGIHIALPDAAVFPHDAIQAPDVAYLRRTFPALRHLTIEGDGIDDRDAAVLSGVEITWRRPVAGSSLRAPELVSVSAPREITVGQRLQIQGRIRGVRSGEELTLLLEGPEGSKRTTTLPAATDEEVAFQITAESAAIAPGAFEWKLRLGPKADSLIFGVVVTPPHHPRTLILQSSPTVEGGRLQRWLTESETPVLMRTRVSAEHHRFSSANGSTGEFDRIDSAVLAKFDVVIACDSALAELSEMERVELEAAIRDTGLGLLVIGDPGGKSPGAPFTPWQLRSSAGTDQTDDRRVSRVRLLDGTELVEPAAVLPAEFVSLQSARWLARDPQDRALVAAFPRGRGWLARSLVADTWRWLQSGHPELFATFWSHVLSAVARSRTSEGQWTLDHDSGPIFDRAPLKLIWSCAADGALPPAQIRSVGDTNDSSVPVELIRDDTESTVARAVFYPSRAGWHEARILPRGPAFAFHVQSKDGLQELQAERHRNATARLAANVSESPSRPGSGNDQSSSRALSPWLWLALFVGSVSALWWGQRK
jgi:hypothetical protein